MAFNKGYELKKFEAHWEKLRIEYAAAGMSDDAIQKILSSSILQKNPIRVSLSVSVTSCSPPAIPKRPADIVDEDKRTRYTEDGSGIRSNP